MSYTKIVQVGAAGNLGTPVLQALLSSGKFDITVLARQNSTFTAPNASVKVAKADFSNHQELIDALKGNEAVVITMGDLPNLSKNSKAIIDAAIDAGVKRIIPSEFGNDLANSPGCDEVVFTPKHQVSAYLAEKGAEGKIEYTTISTGPFFDWGLTHHFIGFDVPNRKATIYNGGTNPFNTATLGSIGASVAAVFANPAPYKNKHIRVSDFYVTQNAILAVLEAETGSKFEVEEVDVNKLKQDSNDGLAKGEFTEANIYGVIKGSIWGTVSSARWGQNDDMEGLGIPKKDLKEEIKKVL